MVSRNALPDSRVGGCWSMQVEGGIPLARRTGFRRLVVRVGRRSLNGLLGTARARTRTFLGATVLVMLLSIAGTSMLVGSGMAGIARSQSARQAAQAADLLGTVGASFPNLTPFVLAHGLSPADAHKLDVVTTRVQHDGLLANVEIWD